MSAEYREVDIWVGSFPTETALDAYLEETPSTDDTCLLYTSDAADE